MTDKKLWGAEPSDWTLFAETLGLCRDLLPVVSVPGAQIAEGSTLKDLGKTPSLYNKDGEVVGIGKWTSRETTPADIEKWSKEDHYGICLQTRGVRALDIDVPDMAKASAITTFIRDFLEESLPTRFRNNSGKCLLAFHLPGDMPKRILRVDGGIIEFLATGQQFIVAGTHPSGERYVWEWLHYDNFPTIFLETFDNLWYALELEFGTAASHTGGLRKKSVNEQDVVTDKVAQFLEEHDHVLEFGPEGQAHIECPFSAQHTTDSAVSATSYFPAGSRGYERGHFVCLHAHCADRTDAEFLDAYGYRVSGFDLVDMGTSDDGEVKEDGPASPGVLNPVDHSAIAYKLLMDRFTVEGIQALVRANGGWYQYGGACYREEEDEAIRGVVRRYLDKAMKFIPETKKKPGEVVPFHPTVPQINAVLDALGTAAYARAIKAPAWLDATKIDATDMVSLTNGLLHIPTRTLRPHTARLFTLNTLPYAYEQEGEPTEWIKFLESAWPGDTESIETLQEMFGYLLTADTSQQKMFLIKGPKRSGKGTIARVLKELVGEANYDGPSLSSLPAQFGMQSLIGKLVAVIPDARVGGNTNKQAIVERLLTVSGEDNTTVDRKHVVAWTGKLTARFVMLTNEIPQLGDASGALASRFIVLNMEQSFYGREDHSLTARLLEELPQILRWALDGKDRLAARGFFRQPKAAAKTVRALEHFNSPILEFADEYCEVGPYFSDTKESLYNGYQNWCVAQGRKFPSTMAQFTADLVAAFPHISEKRIGDPRKEARRRMFTGVRVKNYELGEFEDLV